MHRGKSFAEMVCKWGFKWAKKNEYKVKPTCPYISKIFLVRNPEFL